MIEYDEKKTKGTRKAKLIFIQIVILYNTCTEQHSLKDKSLRFQSNQIVAVSQLSFLSSKNLDSQLQMRTAIL